MQAIAYEGYFKQGRFYASGSVIQIPEEQRAVITILGNEQTDSTKVLTLEKRVAAQNFLQSMQKLRDEGFSEEDNIAIDDLQSGMYKPHFEERL